MKKKTINKNYNLIKKVCLIGLLIYISVILINQQKVLISYKNQQEYYQEKIDSATEYNQTLVAKKENLDSVSYIEATAREKLDMYYSNERVYKNINK